MNADAPGSAALEELVARALAEDLGEGDITTDATVPPGARGRGRIIQKGRGIPFGFEAAAVAFRLTGAGELEPLVAEGLWRNDVPADVARVDGPARALLAAERVALNLLGRLSGVATQTARFVEAATAEGGGAVILDTRDDARPCGPSRRPPSWREGGESPDGTVHAI